MRLVDRRFILDADVVLRGFGATPAEASEQASLALTTVGHTLVRLSFVAAHR